MLATDASTNHAGFNPYQDVSVPFVKVVDTWQRTRLVNLSAGLPQSQKTRALAMACMKRFPGLSLLGPASL